MATAPNEINGVLLVDKPVGPTSFDVVRRVKRLLGVKSAGHTGTLDPNASGLLVVCLGGATRIATFLVEGTKEYEGVVRFGVSTDTLDSQGKVLVEKDATGLDEAAVKAAVEALAGVQDQVAPMYSARKVDGKRLYELARAGETVEREPTEIEVVTSRLVSFVNPDATIFVRCSKGTYIRSLAETLGERLGTGAHLKELRRLSSGVLHVRDAASLTTLEDDAATRGREALLARVLSVETALADLPALALDARHAASVAFGNTVDVGMLERLGVPAPAAGAKVRLVGPDGLVIAVGASDGACVRLLRVLRARTGPGAAKAAGESA